MNLVITGSSSGIGQALARHFTAAGHQVKGLSRRSADCDVSDWDSVQRAAAEISEQWPHVDALLCCAGTQGTIGPAMTVSPNDWTATVRTNLDGTYFTIRAFFDALRRAPRRAKIVCFSGGGSVAPRPNFSAYGVSKAGIVRLVDTLAAEWRELPLDINAIAPGAINTAMTEQITQAGPAAAGDKEFANASNQLKHGGQSIDKVIGLVEFLLSPDSDGISGKLISAQWDDWPSFAARRESLMNSDVYSLRRITENRKS